MMRANSMRRYLPGLRIIIALTILLGSVYLHARADSAAITEGGSVLSEEDFEAVLEQLSPEDMEAIVQSAAQRSLEVERKQVAMEIEENLLYDEKDITEAKRVLAAPSDSLLTRAENIARICQAYAIVDDRFTAAYNLHKNENLSKATERLKESLNPEDASYFSAAVHYLYADCLIRQEKLWTGTETYTELLVNMPDRISFACSASLQAAKVYERMDRNLYAMQMYSYCLSNYALTLTKKELTDITYRYDRLNRMYQDPLGSLTGMLAHVHTRLEKQDVGEGTQKQQQEAIALLEDLIKTTEEKQRPNKNNKNNKNQQRCQKQQKQSQGKKQGGGKQGRPASSQRNPTVGAKESVLVPGPVARPNKLANIHAGGESGAWAELPPRAKEKIRNLMRQRLSERRGEMVRDYHRKLSEGE